MREDEIEALLALDNAGLLVRGDGRVFVATVVFPRDMLTRDMFKDFHVAFTGEDSNRQKAIAIAWQKYQDFMSTEAGKQVLIEGSGQMMFRV